MEDRLSEEDVQSDIADKLVDETVEAWHCPSDAAESNQSAVYTENATSSLDTHIV